VRCTQRARPSSPRQVTRNPQNFPFRPRPCENGWWRGVERPRLSAVAIAGIRRIPTAVVARRLVRARCPHFERWNRVRSAIPNSRGYVLIAAISGPGPMMLMTRVRL
jgi:hypothetical protein